MASKNLMLDLFNSLSSNVEENSLSTVTSMLSDKGVSGVNVCEADSRTGSPLWVLSTMHQSWLNQYVQEEYYECDPFIHALASGQKHVRAVCGTASRRSSLPTKAIDLNHDLLDAGYSVLHGVIFPTGTQTKRKLVTLCMDESVDRTELTEDLFSVAAFITATFQSPTIGQPEIFQVETPAVLSSREREALLRLTSGCKIPQIAYIMSISDTMVHRHLASACKKLGASTREEAIAKALMAGLLSV